MKKRKGKRRKIKEKLSGKFVRINLDKKDYDEYVEFGEIYNHINKSTKKLTKKATIKSLMRLDLCQIIQ